MRLLALAVAGLLAACSPPPAGDSAAPDVIVTRPEPSPPASAVAAPTTLAGEWRVAGIDGRDFNETYGLALSASETEIWWEPRCAGRVRGYAIDSGRIRIAPAPGAPPAPVCEIGVPGRLDEVVRAFDAATAVVRTPSNGIEISGGGHSVLLFSQ